MGSRKDGIAVERPTSNHKVAGLIPTGCIPAMSWYLEGGWYYIYFMAPTISVKVPLSKALCILYES